MPTELKERELDDKALKYLWKCAVTGAVFVDGKRMNHGISDKGWEHLSKALDQKRIKLPRFWQRTLLKIADGTLPEKPVPKRYNYVIFALVKLGLVNAEPVK